ncbi:GntR family transcriptional regulator [Fictibacillus aquaticus]|uniref:GntR family transcriptional regulator n=1 Tax=Fictibacillus aquaticus TaxID=2021314 RepID=A0A235FEW3_9BACL|nr:GntR family transcriptional regulator [Fictibacillus aquaticus]OYD59533.1 GntR family transcriptional regulator [Fictibacillus aquaticus]
MFDLDLRSRKPIYEQLVDKMKELIITDILKSDEQLPSVRTLAQQLTINPNTIQRAYRELEAEGYIYSIKGKGSFVSPASVKATSEKLNKVKEELVKLLSEAMYLGMTMEQLQQMLSEIEEAVKGGSNDD